MALVHISYDAIDSKNSETRGQWNKAVDYLLLTRYMDVNYAGFIDLKSSLNDKPDPSDNLLVTNSNEDLKKEKQFVGAKALFDYLSLVVKKETNNSAFDGYQFRYNGSVDVGAECSDVRMGWGWR